MADTVTAPSFSGQMYTPQNIDALTQQYSSLLDPTYQRQAAQIAQTLGGRGTLYGTPGSNNLQLNANNQANQVGQFATTLEQQGLQEPYQQAALTGNFMGQQTLAGQQQAASLTGLVNGSPTLAATQFNTQAGLAQQQLNNENTASELSTMGNIWQGLGGTSGVTSGLSSLWNQLFPSNSSSSSSSSGIDLSGLLSGLS